MVCPLPIHSLSPFLVRGACIRVLPHLFMSGVPLERYQWGVPTQAGRYPYLPGEREGLIAGSRLQLPHGVAVKICFASRQPSLRCGKHCGVLP